MLSTPPPACVEESSLTPRERREAGRLLAREWGAEWRLNGFAGPYPPAFRMLARNNAGHLIAHVSAFELPCRPSLSLFGIGDLVVKPRYRGNGLARQVCESLVMQCRARGAEAILVDTVAARHIFSPLGFRALNGFEFFYNEGAQCTRRRHWMVWLAAPRGSPIELLANWDF